MILYLTVADKVNKRRAPSQYKNSLSGYGDFHYEDTTRDRLIFTIRIHILLRRHLYTATPPPPPLFKWYRFALVSYMWLSTLIANAGKTRRFLSLPEITYSSRASTSLKQYVLHVKRETLALFCYMDDQVIGDIILCLHCKQWSSDIVYLARELPFERGTGHA